MRPLLAICLVVLTLSVLGCSQRKSAKALDDERFSVTLLWTPSASADVTNHIVYGYIRGPGFITGVVVTNVGMASSLTLTNLAPGNWEFAITSEANGYESKPAKVHL